MTKPRKRHYKNKITFNRFEITTTPIQFTDWLQDNIKGQKNVTGSIQAVNHPPVPETEDQPAQPGRVGFTYALTVSFQDAEDLTTFKQHWFPQ